MLAQSLAVKTLLSICKFIRFYWFIKNSPVNFFVSVFMLRPLQRAWRKTPISSFLCPRTLVKYFHASVKRSRTAFRRKRTGNSWCVRTKTESESTCSWQRFCTTRTNLVLCRRKFGVNNTKHQMRWTEISLAFHFIIALTNYFAQLTIEDGLFRAAFFTPQKHKVTGRHLCTQAHSQVLGFGEKILFRGKICMRNKNFSGNNKIWESTKRFGVALPANAPMAAGLYAPGQKLTLFHNKSLTFRMCFFTWITPVQSKKCATSREVSRDIWTEPLIWICLTEHHSRQRHVL